MGGLLLWKVLCVRASLRVVFAYRREPAEGSQLVACLAEEDRQWGYGSDRPYECFHMLESLAYGLLRTKATRKTAVRAQVIYAKQPSRRFGPP